MKTFRTQTINLTIPTELLIQVDAIAQRDYTSRSDIIRQALLEKIRRPELTDEWGDPLSENWHTMADFRKLNPRGVAASEVVGAIKQLRKAKPSK